MVASPSMVLASDSPSARATLKGIDTVWVLVEALTPGAKTLGLTQEMIQTDVELKLRLAGIRVVTQEEALKLPGSPCLYVDVNVVESAGAASIGVELVQGVRLERNGDAILAPTWSMGTLGRNPSAQDIRDRVKDYVDTFLNALLSVNPKR
jgi:hypothetical protein